MQKAANNRVEVYVKIGLCSTSIDFESLKDNHQRVICSTTDVTFGFGPEGNFLTSGFPSYENTQTNPGADNTLLTLLCFSETALERISLMEKAKIIHSTNTNTAISTL